MYGMCHNRHRSWDHRNREWDDRDADAGWDATEPMGERHDGGVAVKQRNRSERATDADRERVAALLSKAFRDGALRVDELDQRLSAVYAAESIGDLDALTSDLPQGWLEDVETTTASQRRSEAYRRRWRRDLRAYLTVMAVLVGIWFMTAFSAGWPVAERPYFWPIWPILGWGIPLFLGRPRGPIARTVRRHRTARSY